MQGTIVNGFELKRLLGQGGMAEVWLAENEIGKKAAVKMLLPKFCADESIVARFRNEAKVMVELNHFNIRQVYDYNMVGNRPCIVMEYLEGGDLKALMKQGRRFTDEELVKWWNQLVDALNYTHAKGVVHRDIKPSNIFIDLNGDVKLMDFGIAKVKEGISLTQTGAMMGTLVYMSPEQVLDSKHIDYQTDVYSLAVSFVHLLTGKAPYDSTTDSDYIIRKGIVEQELDLSALPEAWRGFLKPYLAKNPQDRPSLRHYKASPLSQSTVKTEKLGKPEPPKPVAESEETVLENAAEEPKPKPNTAPKPTDKPVARLSKKKKIWPWLVAAGVLLVVMLIAFGGKSRDEKAFEACQDIGDYRQYVSQYGLKGRHYAEAKQFIADYVHDSTQKAEKEARLKELKDVPLFAFVENKKIGFIDNKGNVVIVPQFDNTCDFVDDLGAVKMGDYWGFINKLGEMVVPPQFDEVYSSGGYSWFADGLTPVKTLGKWGYIDASGVRVIEPQYEIANPFSEGLAAVKVKGKYGFIDKTGKMIIEPQFDYTYEFSEGLAAVKLDDKFGYIDKTGKMIIDPKYDFSSEFSEGLARVKNDYRYGFINKTGKVIIPLKYCDASPFSEGLACVKNGDWLTGKWGIIDRTGKYVIAPQFDDPASFSEGLALVGGSNHYRFIDRTGKTVIQLPPECCNAGSFKNGLAATNDSDSIRYIDKKGEVVFKYKIPWKQ